MHQWYWSYEYSDFITDSGESIDFDSYMLPDSDLELGQFRLLDVDNKLVIPVDSNIRLIVTGSDVLHSFAVPSLGLKLDCVPGRLNQVSFIAERSGTFYGQCSEICGVWHGFMPIVVEAVSANDFLVWIDSASSDSDSSSDISSSSSSSSSSLFLILIKKINQFKKDKNDKIRIMITNSKFIKNIYWLLDSIGRKIETIILILGACVFFVVVFAIGLGYSFCLIKLNFFKLITIFFFIVLILINIGLYYFEYLESKSKNNTVNYMKSGFGGDSIQLKRISKQFLATAGGISSIIAIKNEFWDKQKVAKLKKELADTKAELAKAKWEASRERSEKIANNMSNGLHIDSIARTFGQVDSMETKKSKLQKTIEECNTNWLLTGKEIHKNSKRASESDLALLHLEEKRVLAELKGDIEAGSKFSDYIVKETEESKIVEKLDEEEISKASILGSEFEKLWTGFEYFNGISKLACTLIFTSSVVLWSVFGIIINLYGNYLIDRFKLEEKYPNIALFIKYRRKLSKYYVVSNLILIITINLTTMFLGFSILSIFIK